MSNVADLVTQDDALRDVPVDVAALESAANRAQEQLASVRQRDDRSEVLRLLGSLGECCRVLRRLDDAVAYLDEAMAMAQAAGNAQAELANMLRLAEARK